MKDPHAYVAVPAEGPILREAIRIQARLREVYPKVQCLPRQTLHLTLDDLGPVPSASLEAVTMVCGQAVRRQGPFSARVTGLCAFPNPQTPRIIGLLVDDDRERLARLRHRIHEGLMAYGFAVDTRIWLPHIALARLPEGAAPLDGSFRFAECSLKVQAVQVIQQNPMESGPAWSMRWAKPLRRLTQADQPPEPAEERALLERLLDERIAAHASRGRRTPVASAAHAEKPVSTTRKKRSPNGPSKS